MGNIALLVVTLTLCLLVGVGMILPRYFEEEEKYENLVFGIRIATVIFTIAAALCFIIYFDDYMGKVEMQRQIEIEYGKNDKRSGY